MDSVGTVELTSNFIVLYPRINGNTVLRRPVTVLTGALGSMAPDTVMLVTTGGAAAVYGLNHLTTHTLTLYKAHHVRNGDIVRKARIIQEKFESHFGDTFKNITNDTEANIFLEKCKADPRIIELLEKYFLARQELKLVSDLDVLLANDYIYGSMHVYYYECIERLAVERGVLTFCQVGSNIFLSDKSVIKSLMAKVLYYSNNATTAVLNAKENPFEASGSYVTEYNNASSEVTTVISKAPSENDDSLPML
jgi:hypothetical protein